MWDNIFTCHVKHISASWKNMKNSLLYPISKPSHFWRKTMSFRKMHFLIFKSCCKTLCFLFVRIFVRVPDLAKSGTRNKNLCADVSKNFQQSKLFTKHLKVSQKKRFMSFWSIELLLSTHLYAHLTIFIFRFFYTN